MRSVMRIPEEISGSGLGFSVENPFIEDVSERSLLVLRLFPAMRAGCPAMPGSVFCRRSKQGTRGVKKWSVVR